MKTHRPSILAASLAALLMSLAAPSFAGGGYQIRIPVHSLTTAIDEDDGGGGGETDPDTGPLRISLKTHSFEAVGFDREGGVGLEDALVVEGEGREDFDASEIQWSIVGGAIPPGMALDRGFIYGTPSTMDATYNFDVEAKYKAQTARGSYQLSVKLFALEAKMISGANTNCALTDTGAVKCWGMGEQGGLGNGQANDSKVPVFVNTMTSGVTHVDSSTLNACAVKNGAAFCWGLWPGGNSTLRPVGVLGLSSGVKSVHTGNNHNCAIQTSGTVKCWGNNDSGQLGTGVEGGWMKDPVDVVGLSDVKDIGIGEYHTCALTNAGAVKCWGNNLHYQLGVNIEQYAIPEIQTLPGLESGVTAIGIGGNHGCAATSSGQLKCWGDNAYGQLGTGNRQAAPTAVVISGLVGQPVKVTASNSHTCTLSAAGTIQCWGQNGGRIGDGTRTDRLYPTAVLGLGSGARDVSAGENGTCAIRTDGKALCWGGNYRGQLGNGNAGSGTDKLLPSPVAP